MVRYGGGFGEKLWTVKDLARKIMEIMFLFKFFFFAKSLIRSKLNSKTRLNIGLLMLYLAMNIRYDTFLVNALYGTIGIHN